MKSELVSDTITEQDTTVVIKNVFGLVEKKRAERRALCSICGAIALILALVLLIDNLGFLQFIGVFLTTFGLIAGIGLLVFSIYRKKRNLPYKTTLIIGLILLTIPIVFVSILVAGFLMGSGPT